LVTLRKPLYVAPFSPGVDRLNFVPVNAAGDFAGVPRSLARERDFSVFQAATDVNPIRFSGYTHGVGAAGERYTGLSILDPAASVKSVDYFKTEFFLETNWAESLK
jgi:hypothetical protein